MKNNKGLTLIELLAVLAIIALLALIIYPLISSVIKDSAQDTENATRSSVQEAAKMYLTDQLEFNDVSSATVSFNDLISGGYLTIDESKYNLQTSKVKITKDGNSYSFTIVLCPSDSNTCRKYVQGQDDYCIIGQSGCDPID